MNYTIPEILEMIDEPNRTACKKIYASNEQLFKTAPGSSHNHQAWKGGYNHHITEVMNICLMLYPIYKMRPLNFSLSDALLVMFLHDLEKPWKNELDDEIKNLAPIIRIGEAHYGFKKRRKAFRQRKIKEYNIQLTSQQQNALEYVEGENDDYSSKKRIMNELAAFCHIADVSSARIWHDYPKLMYAELYWRTEEQGGRSIPIIPNLNRGLSYWANTYAKDNTSWSIGVYFEDNEPVLMGTTGKYEIKFITPEAHGHFASGDVLFVCEGKRIIGEGKIL